MSNLDAPLLVFNELSLRGATAEDIEREMPRLAALTRQASVDWPGLKIASPAGALGALPTDDPSVTFAAIGLGTGGSVRDAWLQFARLADKLITHVEVSFDSEYKVGDVPAVGLGVAAEVGHVGLSVASSEAWLSFELQLKKTYLDDDGELESELCNVLHVAEEEHLHSHQGYLRDLHECLDFESFLSRHCPRIDLIPRVWASVQDLERAGGVMRPIRTRLLELNESVTRWDPKASPAPDYSTLVTPESETRRKLCDFLDTEGSTHNYGTHARFTPGAGRIHFRLLVAEGEGRIEVGHIGKKLS